ncbi:MAG: hypothetical protein Aurels2KO_50380 [Aureliella sp.]
MNSFHLPASKKSFGEITKHLGDVVAAKQPSLADRRRNLEYLAWLLDESIEIPGLKFKIGLDSLIGLIPGVGDLASAGLSTYIVASAAWLGIPKTVVAQMAFNSTVDAVIGLVPIVGDLFDAVFKSNKRNLNLVMESLENPKRGKRLAMKNFFWVATMIVGCIGIPLALLIAAISALVS